MQRRLCFWCKTLNGSRMGTDGVASMVDMDMDSHMEHGSLPATITSVQRCTKIDVESKLFSLGLYLGAMSPFFVGSKTLIVVC